MTQMLCIICTQNSYNWKCTQVELLSPTTAHNPNMVIHYPQHKGKGTYTWYSASAWIISSEALRYGTWSHSFTCTPTRSSAIRM